MWDMKGWMKWQNAEFWKRTEEIKLKMQKWKREEELKTAAAAIVNVIN